MKKNKVLFKDIALGAPCMRNYFWLKKCGIVLFLMLQFLFSFTAYANEISSDIRMYVGESKILRLPAAVNKIAIGNGKVVSAASVNPTEILVIANDAGDSSVHLWLKNKTEVSYSVRVTSINIPKIATQIKQLFNGDENIGVQIVGDRIFLEATDITNLQAKKIEALEKAYPNEFIAILGGAQNLQERTIHMEAKVIEIKKSALDDLGIRWNTQNIDGPSIGILGDMVRNNTYVIRPDEGPFTGITHNINPFETYFGIASAISSSINLLEQKGDAYIVAAPQLVSRCGGKADFNSGGELPVPIVTGLGQVSVEYKPYGIRLQIEPLCDSRGNVRAKVLSEVSQIDRSTTVQGVPGLLTRRTESELDLEDGRPMMLAGLASLRASEDKDQVPWLGNAPLLGNLFSNKTLGGERTELVVLITPAIVTPESERIKREIFRGEQIEERINRKLERQRINSLDSDIEESRREAEKEEAARRKEAGKEYIPDTRQDNTLFGGG